MKKRLILVLFCLLAFPVVASHIVGGEFEIVHISGNTYRINLILYFDELNGNPGARDPGVTARIFRKRDNAVMMNVPLSMVRDERVSYTQPSCSKGEIVTSKLTYSTTVQLGNQSFSDPEGYYLAWERCCRNYSITNIFSQEPLGGGQYAGQTFYLEFPPVTKDGSPFINSSPRLFPPLNDYACPRKPYYVDFAGVDDDGDSLVYSLVTPLNTKSADALPPGDQLPRPRPYPTVTWRPTYGLGNMIGGQPDLKISDDGFLTVTPTQQGLFVFAVRCEEYRDGKKIGEVRRDFQMLVVDVCPRAEPPQIVGKAIGDATTYDEQMTVSFASGIADSVRCIEVVVSDPDASKQDDNFMEKVRIRAIPLNFKKDIKDILPSVTNAVLVDGSTKTFTICFDECPPFKGGPFQVGIVAYDDACSLPLSDTLKITVFIDPPPNDPPVFDVHLINDIVEEEHSVSYMIRATDANNDPLIVGMIAGGFSLESAGMRLEQITQTNGLYAAKLHWDAYCEQYDFTHKSNFQIQFVVEDQDQCNFAGPDRMNFNLAVDLPDNDPPTIRIDPPQIEDGVTRKIFENLNFNLIGEDPNEADTLELKLYGNGFNTSQLGMTFPGAIGFQLIESPFDWTLACDKLNLSDKSDFELVFIVVEDDKCGFNKSDTLTVNVHAEPPGNDKPLLNVVNTNPALSFVDNQQSLIIGQQISLGLTSNDPNSDPQDNIIIDLASAEGSVPPEGYIFASASGTGSAQTTFTWDTECSIFQNGVYENNYTFKFITRDDRCFNEKADTVEVNFTIKDIEGGDTEFLPPNIITPNGDGCNDFFAMEGMDDMVTVCGEFNLTHLPKDNCIGRFTSIIVYNRWGRKIYESSQRNFRWYPENEAAGVYFYTLKYSHKEYKGSLTLRN